MIHVERDSQKGMVIGKGGAEDQGDRPEAARRKIEEFMGGQVFSAFGSR